MISIGLQGSLAKKLMVFRNLRSYVVKVVEENLLVEAINEFVRKQVVTDGHVILDHGLNALNIEIAVNAI